MSDDDDTYEIPLQDQRVFGAGIKRKRVKFVPSSTPSTPLETTTSAKSVSNLYLSLVLPKEVTSTEMDKAPTLSANLEDLAGDRISESSLCEVCKLPQVSLDVIVPVEHLSQLLAPPLVFLIHLPDFPCI